jgi:hypothetical protein
MAKCRIDPSKWRIGFTKCRIEPSKSRIALSKCRIAFKKEASGGPEATALSCGVVWKT